MRTSQHRLYKYLTAPNVTWSCRWEQDTDANVTGAKAGAGAGTGTGPQQTVVLADPVQQDTHSHTLVITCRIPPHVLRGGTLPCGRYRLRADVVAVAPGPGATVLSDYHGVAVCSRGQDGGVGSSLGTAGPGSGAKTPGPTSGGQLPGGAAAAVGSRVGHGHHMYLAACTMISESGSYDRAALAKVWATYVDNTLET